MILNRFSLCFMVIRMIFRKIADLTRDPPLIPVLTTFFVNFNFWTTQENLIPKPAWCGNLADFRFPDLKTPKFYSSIINFKVFLKNILLVFGRLDINLHFRYSYAEVMGWLGSGPGLIPGLSKEFLPYIEEIVQISLFS